MGAPTTDLLKVNFDESIIDRRGGASFVIHGPDSILVATRGSHLFESTVLGVELHVA